MLWRKQLILSGSSVSARVVQTAKYRCRARTSLVDSLWQPKHRTCAVSCIYSIEWWLSGWWSLCWVSKNCLGTLFCQNNSDWKIVSENCPKAFDSNSFVSATWLPVSSRHIIWSQYLTRSSIFSRFSFMWFFFLFQKY